MNETLKVIGAIFATLIPVIAFIYWHFKTVNGFKDEINQLKIEMKELEKRDDLQQQTLDQLKELYPVLKQVMEKLNKEKK